MTVAEFCRKAEQSKFNQAENPNGIPFAETMKQCTNIWSNDGAKGYCIYAMIKAGLDNATMREVIAQMESAFDSMPLDKAEWIAHRALGELGETI